MRYNSMLSRTFCVMIFTLSVVCHADEIAKTFESVKHALQQNKPDEAKKILGTNPSVQIVEYADTTENTLLHYAVMQKAIEVAEILVKNGASIFQKNAQGKTPVMLAIGNNLMHLVNKVMLATYTKTIKQETQVLKEENHRYEQEALSAAPKQNENLPVQTQPSSPSLPAGNGTAGGRAAVHGTKLYPHTPVILSQDERNDLNGMTSEELQRQLAFVQQGVVAVTDPHARTYAQAKIEYITMRLARSQSRPQLQNYSAKSNKPYVLTEEDKKQLRDFGLASFNLEDLEEELSEVRGRLTKPLKAEIKARLEKERDFLIRLIKDLQGSVVESEASSVQVAQPQSGNTSKLPPPPPPMPTKPKINTGGSQAGAGGVSAEALAQKAGQLKKKQEVAAQQLQPVVPTVPSQKAKWDMLKAQGNKKALEEEASRLRKTTVKFSLTPNAPEAQQVGIDLKYVNGLLKELEENEPETEEEWEI